MRLLSFLMCCHIRNSMVKRCSPSLLVQMYIYTTHESKWVTIISHKESHTSPIYIHFGFMQPGHLLTIKWIFLTIGYEAILVHISNTFFITFITPQNITNVSLWKLSGIYDGFWDPFPFEMFLSHSSIHLNSSSLNWHSIEATQSRLCRWWIPS